MREEILTLRFLNELGIFREENPYYVDLYTLTNDNYNAIKNNPALLIQLADTVYNNVRAGISDIYCFPHDNEF